MGDEPERIKPETLTLLLELAGQSPEAQLKAADAVDSKIFQSFAAGSILIGLAAAGNVDRDCLTVVFVSCAVAAFLVLAGAAIWALWSRRFRIPMSSRQLWERYWGDEPDDVRHAFLEDLAGGYDANERHIRRKHKALRVVLLALFVESGAIGAALLATVA